LEILLTYLLSKQNLTYSCIFAVEKEKSIRKLLIKYSTFDKSFCINFMRTFGIIGKSLVHSASQDYFTQKFKKNHICDAEYKLFPLASIEEVKPLLNHPALFGFNVTSPYKTEIIFYLDELDIVAEEVGAVNCVVKENGKWKGYNTDVLGFEKMFVHCNNSALVLGSGGAAKAVCFVLRKRNIPFKVVSRKKTEETTTYDEITESIIHRSSIIINTTPLGMFPNMEALPPIPYQAIGSHHILIDLIYNPEETLFLKEGRKMGAFTLNGLTMFEAQAEATFKMFMNLR
jgi:shikimate dehydrogenase